MTYPTYGAARFCKEFGIRVETIAWDLSEKDAQILQERLASRVIISDEVPRRLEVVARVDVAYGEDKKLTFAAAVVLDGKRFASKKASARKVRFDSRMYLVCSRFGRSPAIEKALKRLVGLT